MKRLVFAIFTLSCFAMLLLAAGSNGTWNNINPGAGGPAQLVLQTQGSVLSGTADGQAIGNGKAESIVIWFTAVRANVTYQYKGKINGNVLKLTETRMDGSGVKSLTYTQQ
jgi:hypothetical protein